MAKRDRIERMIKKLIQHRIELIMLILYEIIFLDFTIIILNRVSNRTALAVARTILHEAIHARLFEFFYSRNLNLRRMKLDFPGVYDFFRRHKNKKYGSWGHNQMAEYYRETIAKGLKHFDNGRHPWEYYMDLAWEGLPWNSSLE